MPTISCIDGFEEQTAANLRGPIALSSAASGVSYVTTPAWKNHGYALKILNPGAARQTTGTPVWGPNGVGGLFSTAKRSILFAFQVHTLPNANDTICQTGEQYNARLSLKTTGELGLSGADNPTVYSWTTAQLAVDTWYLIAFSDDGTGAATPMDVWLYSAAGSLIEHVQRARTHVGAAQSIYLLASAATIEVYFDAVCAEDGVNEDLLAALGYGGGYDVGFLEPNSTGYTEGSPTGNYTALDEMPDMEADVVTLPVNAMYLCGFPNPNTLRSAGRIAAVQIFDVWGLSAGVAGQLVVRSNGVNYALTAYSIPTGPSYYNFGRIDNTDPNGGAAWTSASVAAFMAGWKGTSGTGYLSTVSMTYVYQMGGGGNQAVWWQ